MVLDYYKLREQPFGVTPDARYLFRSPTHQEALASLLYGVKAGRGFVALIAMPGLGKTTLLFHALDQLRGDATTVFVFQTISTPEEFLRALLTDLGSHEIPETLVGMQFMLNEVLTEQSRSGKRLVVVIDEAQNLSEPVLELVRMLSNFETPREKLIQIILSGQPQLAEKLQSPKLVQLRQRISIYARLDPLSAKETELYIAHRLRIAGCNVDDPLFTADALALVAQGSEGIPRNINNLCFNALSLGCASKKRKIGCDIVREVIADLDLEPLRKRKFLPQRPQEGGAQEAPAFLSAASTPPRSAGWLPKVAIAGVVLLVAAGAVVWGHRWAPQKIIAQASNVAQPIVPAIPLSLAETRATRPAIEASRIRVMPKQTLYRICTENFGTCNPELLREIRGLNPWLNDPDHIESGQTIRIPVIQKLSVATQSVVKPDGKASLSERGMQ
jgi:type II secretory pathway predicted ATPase ExeA